MGDSQFPVTCQKGLLTLNLKIKQEMRTLSPLGVKDRRECKRHEKSRVSAEMLKTTSALKQKTQSKAKRQARRDEEREQDVLGIGH